MITTVSRRPFLPYGVLGLVLFYFGHLMVVRYQIAPDVQYDYLGVSKVEWAFAHFFDYNVIDLSFSLWSLYVGGIFFLLVMMFYLRLQRIGDYRYGEEHGSAKYACVNDLMTFRDDFPQNNMIFTQHAQMGLFNNRLPYDRQFNKNVLVIGGPGSAKTLAFVKTNALQGVGSYVFTDTKGLLIRELGHFFDTQGYNIKIFDLVTFLNSNRFNPYKYMRNELDIDRVVEALVSSTTKSDNKGENFWVQAENLLIRALVGYLYFDSKISGYVANLPQVSELLRHIERIHPDVESVLELLFNDLNKQLPNNYANRQWALFNDNFHGETRRSVVAIVSARFSVFDHEAVKNLLSEDTMEMDTWNSQKTAVFMIVPEDNEAYQFISALFMHTFFEVSMRSADDIIAQKKESNEGLLHIQVYADEFAQTGKIPKLSERLSTMRSREMSMKIIVQSLSQPRVIYGKDIAEVLMDNCDSLLYLGSNNKETIEYISFRAGTGTIQDNNQSETRSMQGSTSTQHSKIKRDVLTPHEVATIGIDEALLIVNKQNIFRDKKYYAFNHPNACYLSNSPQDDKWYRYKRYMNDIDEFRDNVRPSQLLEVNQEEIEAFGL